ncbi:MAG: phosphoribosylanthranilate isomerase [Burkholderiaceae bacterium]|nr:phosphoribosylanthranilate isomerase [Burkholderiaceae bacterium]
MRTLIKFCGLVRPDDVRTAVALGVDAIGFVFYPHSPRLLEPAQAAGLRRLLPSWVAAVGLFVNAPAGRVRCVAGAVGLDVIQFHGDETPQACEHERPAGLPWWRAVRMRQEGDLIESLGSFARAEALLLDSHSAGFGGSGEGFDWSWVPRERPLPIVLSGGLEAGTVGAAIARVRPTMVDVSSGIEVNAPRADARAKSRLRMESFVAAVQRADAMQQDLP